MSSDNRARKGARTTLALVLTAAMLALFGLAAPTEASTAASHRAGAMGHGHHASALMKLRGTTSDGRHFKGTFRPTSFDVVNGALMATGTVKGWLVGKGRPVPVASQQVTTQVLSANGTDLTGASASRTTTSSYSSAPSGVGVVPAAATCPILHLVLGPLDLDVLGLQVHLNQVVLNIVAQSGAGELLGNLLCAVAGLLDGGSPLSQLLTQLSGLLNQLLGALGGLAV